MSRLEVPHRGAEILVPHPNLQRSDIGPRPQLIRRVRCPKFMQKPALTVRADAAVTILLAATRPAIKPRAPGDALQAFQKMVTDTTGLAREHPRTIKISRGSYDAETFNKMGGKEYLPLFPGFWKETTFRLGGHSC